VAENSARLADFIRDLPERSRDIIALLLRNPEGLGFNEIYRRLRKKIGSPTTLSRKLKELVEEGIVETQGGPRRKNVYKLKPWVFERFHRLFVLGISGLSFDEEASFLKEFLAIFVSAKKAADRVEELLTAERREEVVTWGLEDVAKTRVIHRGYKPEGCDIDIFMAMMWPLRELIDAVAHVLILGSRSIDEEREAIIESVDRFLRVLSEHAGKVDIDKWGDVWFFLSGEWLKYYLALANWLKPKIEGEDYPKPITLAELVNQKHRALTSFGMVWRHTLMLTRCIMYAQALSRVLSLRALEFNRKLSEELAKLWQEHPELVGTVEGEKRAKEIVERLMKEFRTELEEDPE